MNPKIESINNFTILRLVAALSVLFGHAYILSNGVNQGEDFISNFLVKHYGESLPSLAVDIFFVISGYLIVASYTRHNNLYKYFKARILRIYPALFAAVLFSIIIGAFCTNLPVLEYFTNPEVMEFLRINTFALNTIKFNLPGVFIHNPYPISVNGSLWTLAIELKLYIGVSILGMLWLLKKNNFNIFFLILFAACLFGSQSILFIDNARNIQLVLLFFAGSFLYLNKEVVEPNFKIWTLITIIFIGLNFLTWLFFPIKFIWLAYTVILLAKNQKLINRKFIISNDISYGIYIYAFPIQQMLAYSFGGINFISMLFISLVLTIFMALLSWHFIEKPFLRFKSIV